MSDNILRAAAYCRVSTDKDEQKNSIESQKQFFADFISSHKNWQLSEIYFDEGKSGTTTKNRSGFNAMIADCKKGLIDIIITKEVSRFARNTVDTLMYTRMLKKLGINVIFLNDGIDTLQSDGELRLSLMSCIAQEESRKTSERVKWGQRRQMEKGVVFGRNMLGYDVIGGKLFINEKGAEIVRSIFIKYTAEGKSTRTIADELNSCGAQSLRGGKWNSTSVLRILRNEKYAGDLCQGKTCTPDPLDHVKKYQHDFSKMVYIKDHHSPVISRDLWELTQSELKRRSPVSCDSSRFSSKHWCSGMIKCGLCGHNFVQRRKKLLSGNDYYAWRCPAVGCRCGSVNEKVLLEAVCFTLKLLLPDAEQMAEHISCNINNAKTMNSGASIAGLKRELRKLESSKLNICRKLADGLLSDDEFTTLRLQIQNEISQLEEKLSAANQQTYFLSAIQELLTFNTPNTSICREVLENITVLPCRQLEVRLKGSPTVKLACKTSGRCENYSVKFDIVK